MALYDQLPEESRRMLSEGFRWLPVAYPLTTVALRIHEATLKPLRPEDEDLAQVEEAIRQINELYGETWNRYVRILNKHGLLELKAVKKELDIAHKRLEGEPPTLDSNPEYAFPIGAGLDAVKSVVAFRLSVIRNVVLRAAVFGDVAEWEALGDERESMMGESYVTEYTEAVRTILHAWRMIGDVRFGTKRDIYDAIAMRIGKTRAAVTERLREKGIDAGGLKPEQLRSNLDRAARGLPAATTQREPDGEDEAATRD